MGNYMDIFVYIIQYIPLFINSFLNNFKKCSQIGHFDHMNTLVCENIASVFHIYY